MFPRLSFVWMQVLSPFCPTLSGTPLSAASVFTKWTLVPSIGVASMTRQRLTEVWRHWRRLGLLSASPEVVVRRLYLPMMFRDLGSTFTSSTYPNWCWRVTWLETSPSTTCRQVTALNYNILDVRWLFMQWSGFLLASLVKQTIFIIYSLTVCYRYRLCTSHCESTQTILLCRRHILPHKLIAW